MNQTLAKAEGFLNEAHKITWRDIHVTDREMLRVALIKKHGSLTVAAEALELPYPRLSAAICGRESLLYVVATLQSDLGLSDDQVLNLWPLLKKWPRKSRVAS